jgi:hypothetical protein
MIRPRNRTVSFNQRIKDLEIKKENIDVVARNGPHYAQSRPEEK